MKRRPRVLITNDDGIYSKGIHALCGRLKRHCELHVVAPESEQSAAAHSITMSEPLRIKPFFKNRKQFGYAVSGTPADCVKIAIRAILKKRPDIVVSGINLGPNVGYSVLYSGTVSGAREGAIFGIPSVAVSLATFKDPDYEYASAFTSRLVRLLYEKGLPKGVFLNVNIPACGETFRRGVRITRQGLSPIIESYEKRQDPRNESYYWLTGEVIKLKADSSSDINAVKKRYVSVTPLHCDMTRDDFLEEAKTWKIR